MRLVNDKPRDRRLLLGAAFPLLVAVACGDSASDSGDGERGGSSFAGSTAGGAAGQPVGGRAGSAGSGIGGRGVGGSVAGQGVGGSLAGSAGSPAAGTGGTSAGAAGSGDGGKTGEGGKTGGGAGGNMPAAGAGGATAGQGGKTGGGAGGQAGMGQAGSGQAGSSGNCPTNLVGWASVSGDGVTTTTGGGNATPVRPTSAQQLMDYAADATPRVIEISGSFNVPRLQVASNKTLVGLGQNATLNGGIRIRGNSSTPVQNVILRNVRVNGATTDVDGDAVQIYFAHHVWVDHCEIYDGVDANLDVVHGSNWVTVSWTKFRYTAAAPDPEHKFSSLVGHSDNNASEDDGRLKVTFHHNWWAEGVTERMPRARFGQVHVFNNYYNSPGNNYCVRAGRNAHLLVEGNYFDGSNSPHEFNNAEDEATAHITARNNEYDGTTGTRAVDGGGAPFTNPGYTATLDAAATVPQRVQQCAGPRP